MEKTKRIHLRASELDEKNLIEAAQKLGTDKISSTICKSLETVAEMEKELFFVDRQKIKLLDEISEYSRAHLQNFVDEFYRVTDIHIEFSQLQVIFENIGKLSSKILLEQAIRDMVRHLLYSHLSAIHDDFIITDENIPQKDLSVLFKIAERLDRVPTIQIGSPETIYWGTLSLTESGKIIVLENEVEKLKAAYRQFAETPQELARLAKVRKLTKVLNELCEDPDLIPEQVFRLVYYDREAARWDVTGSYVKFAIEPQKILFTR